MMSGCLGFIAHFVAGQLLACWCIYIDRRAKVMAQFSPGKDAVKSVFGNATISYKPPRLLVVVSVLWSLAFIAYHVLGVFQ